MRNGIKERAAVFGRGPRPECLFLAKERKRKVVSPSASALEGQQAVSLITALADLWPHCFALLEQRRRPLKNGIHADILAAAKGAITADEIKVALRRYCRSAGYLLACTEGAARIGLDGKVAGKVTGNEAKFARETLALRKPQKLRPKPARSITPAPKPPEAGIRRITPTDLRVAARERRERGAA
jgi:sRNA-binding protein